MLYNYPIKISGDLYVAPIKYFSSEIGFTYNPYEGLEYYELGIGLKYLEKARIKPNEKCIATPLGGKPKSFIEKFKENRFEIIPLDDSFSEVLYPLQKGGIILPEILENSFGDAKHLVLNFAPFRTTLRKNNPSIKHSNFTFPGTGA